MSSCTKPEFRMFHSLPSAIWTGIMIWCPGILHRYSKMQPPAPDEYLRLLTDVIVASAESELPGTPCWRGLAGYSLAGLFAVYALYGTDAFSRIASISGSLWLPGIKEYVVSHKPRRLPDRLYFSLGDKESKTRNPLLKTVGENTQAIYSYYRSQGIHTVFELNPGNHYNQAARRTAKGIAWLLKQ